MHSVITLILKCEHSLNNKISVLGAKSEGEGPISSEEESVATDRGYTSDSELTKSPKHNSRPNSPQTTSPQNNATGGWILVIDYYHVRYPILFYISVLFCSVFYNS